MKKVLFTMAVVAAVALVSCNDKKAAENTDANSADSSLILEEEETVILTDDTATAPVSADTTAVKAAQPDSTKAAK